MDQRRGPIVIDQIEQLGETTDARVSTHVPYIFLKLETKEADHNLPHILIASRPLLPPGPAPFEVDHDCVLLTAWAEQAVRCRPCRASSPPLRPTRASPVTLVPKQSKQNHSNLALL